MRDYDWRKAEVSNFQFGHLWQYKVQIYLAKDGNKNGLMRTLTNMYILKLGSFHVLVDDSLVWEDMKAPPFVLAACFAATAFTPMLSWIIT